MAEPKIGLALGAGGARGLAHLGVLKVFEQEKIPISYIAGSSIGAIVGSFYAAGQKIEQLEKFSIAFKRKYFLDFTVPKLGFIAGNRLKDFIRIFSYNKNIEDLHIPVAIVATDIETGEKVVFRKGPVADAVRASIAIPGIFTPEKIDGRMLVDGGVVDRVPVSVVKEMGADIVIGVDVAGFKKNAQIQSIYDIILQSIDIMQMEIVRNRGYKSDVIIQPPVQMFSSYSFTNVEEIIQLGEKEAKKRMKDIHSVIKKWKESKN
ncbi:patatin-like phospholipase family protein [Fervidibacillus halotolerans]|uniref:Patatin-like phospholipase family protein n=1 Tax=Fervidibacillus halotolerans TaxID=2980027 RepID=A0A9E8M1B9_9BACI|nr:patatin-like phospholipase family protein [Fervidibacillus halotolerans]WAA13703.1 patatin-like phospholipase family protein [Fervidibacillus halotolerans]